MNNVMLDIKALGEYRDAPLLAIEAVFFEPSTGKIGAQYYRAINLSRTRSIDPAAVIELLKKDSPQRAEIVNATCSEFDALALFFDFIRKNVNQSCEPFFWTENPAYAWQWLDCSTGRNNLDSSFIPHFSRCLSTLALVAAVAGYTPHPRRPGQRNTLTDAFYRAEQCCEIWQYLTNPHLESL